MNALLRTETLTFLRAFRNRHNRILWTRGGAVVAATGLGLLLLLAIADWSLLIPDSIRWSLSVLAYGLAGIAAWWLALRNLGAAATDEKAAALVLAKNAHVGEELLSAVELGHEQSLGNAHYDSLEFRAQLQSNVAGKVEQLEMASLLPFRQTQRALLTLAITLMTIVALCFVPDLNLVAHFRRAALPFVNLARPSNLRLTIVEPSPADGRVPIGDELVMLVETLGERSGRVELELVDPERGTTRTEMRREALNRFSAKLSVENNMKYRIRSGDALTKFHTIVALPRPTVTVFEKTYHFPSYTGSEDVTVSEVDGHLSAVEGSRAALRMISNIAVDYAEFRLQPSTQTEETVVPVRVAEDGKTLTGELPISSDYIAYRVHLKSKEHHVNNRFDPTYEIQSTPDVAPRVVLEAPSHDREVVQNESLLIEGLARDDYGVSRFSRLWKVGLGEWQEERL